LKEDCQFEKVKILEDKDALCIQREYEQLMNLASNAADFQQHLLVFFYYSGHGTLNDRGTTVGHTVNGELFQVEEMARNLARAANTFVISFLDCCREIIQKNVPQPQPQPQQQQAQLVFGQLYLILASQVNTTTHASINEKLSFTTDSFLRFVKSNENGTEFRTHLLGWEQKNKGAVINDQTSLWIFLNSNPRPTTTTTTTTPTPITTTPITTTPITTTPPITPPPITTTNTPPITPPISIDIGQILGNVLSDSGTVVHHGRTISYVTSSRFEMRFFELRFFCEVQDLQTGTRATSGQTYQSKKGALEHGLQNLLSILPNNSNSRVY